MPTKHSDVKILKFDQPSSSKSQLKCYLEKFKSLGYKITSRKTHYFVKIRENFQLITRKEEEDGIEFNLMYQVNELNKKDINKIYFIVNTFNLETLWAKYAFISGDEAIKISFYLPNIYNDELFKDFLATLITDTIELWKSKTEEFKYLFS